MEPHCVNLARNLAFDSFYLPGRNWQAYGEVVWLCEAHQSILPGRHLRLISVAWLNVPGGLASESVNYIGCAAH